MASDLETLQQENATLRSELQTTRTELQTTQRELKKALDTIKQLGVEIETLKRKQARQTTPFSKNTPKANPKPSGRKKGEGKFTFKTTPTLNEITQVINVPIVNPNCPKCGVPLPSTPSGIRVAYLLEMPKVTPQITAYHLEQKTCIACGVTITAMQARVADDQLGATAFRLSSES
jgi:transposase